MAVDVSVQLYMSVPDEALEAVAAEGSVVALADVLDVLEEEGVVVVFPIAASCFGLHFALLLCLRDRWCR